MEEGKQAPSTQRPAPSTPAQQSPEQGPAKTEGTPQKGGSAAVLIIVIVLAVLVVLGVGGYFAWKYLGKKIGQTVTGTASVTSTSTTKSKLTIKAVEDMFKYPNGTITDTNREKVGGRVSMVSTETPDGFTTVQNYYVALANQKKYTVSEKSQSGDASSGYGGWVKIETTEFSVEVYIHQFPNEKTTIDVGIFSESLAEGEGITATSSVTPTSGSTAKTSSDYIISDSNTRVISKSELTSLTPWQLKVARNEIYARHGREFVHKDLQCYFATKSWYKINSSFSESDLSTTENKNVATIQAYEQEIGSPLASQDSGCQTNS